MPLPYLWPLKRLIQGFLMKMPPLVATLVSRWFAGARLTPQDRKALEDWFGLKGW